MATLWRVEAAVGALGVLGGDGPLFTAELDELSFRPGVDDERTAWPQLHPGPLSAWMGWRSKRIALPFTLDAAPAGWCELRVEVLALQGVSVKSVVQKGLRDQVRLVMVVHPVLESRFAAAMEMLAGLGVMRAPPRAIRVLEEEFLW